MKWLMSGFWLFFFAVPVCAGDRILSNGEWPAFLVICGQFDRTHLDAVDCSVVDRVVSDLRLVANAGVHDEGERLRALEAFSSALFHATLLMMKDDPPYSLVVGDVDMKEKFREAFGAGRSFVDLSHELENLGNALAKEPSVGDLNNKVQVLVMATAVSLTSSEIDRLAVALPRLVTDVVEEYSHPRQPFVHSGSHSPIARCPPIF